jgi:hypothetical protein
MTLDYVVGRNGTYVNETLLRLSDADERRATLSAD